PEFLYRPLDDLTEIVPTGACVGPQVCAKSKAAGRTDLGRTSMLPFGAIVCFLFVATGFTQSSSGASRLSESYVDQTASVPYRNYLQPEIANPFAAPWLLHEDANEQSQPAFL